MFSVKSPTVLAPVGSRFGILFLVALIQIQMRIQSVEALWFYDGKNYTGAVYKIPDGWDDDEPETGIKDCWNIPQFNDRASSMVVQEGCVILYDSFVCSGRSATFTETYNPDLGVQNFDNIASAFRACPLRKLDA